MEYLFYEVVNTELQFHYKRIPSKALFLPFFEEGYFKEQPQGVSEPCQKSKIELFVKIVHGNYFRKKLHLRCLTGF